MVAHSWLSSDSTSSPSKDSMVDMASGMAHHLGCVGLEPTPLYSEQRAGQIAVDLMQISDALCGNPLTGSVTRQRCSRSGGRS
jgi:hypothetical protein